MKLLLFFVSFSCFAQTVHINKMKPDLKLDKVPGTQVHEYQPSLVQAQADFQKKVFSKAKVETKVSTLDFEAKEDLLELLEDEDQAAFIKRYPQFTPAEAKLLKAALYE